MKQLNEVRFEDSNYELSLSKMTDKKIKDVCGYISMEFGDPVFKLTTIVMEDGTKYGAEGEHDMPYLTDMDDEMMQDLYNQENE